MIDELVTVRHLGPDVSKREKLLDKFADRLHHGPAHRPSNRQQSDGDLRGQTGGHGGPVDVAAVLGQQESDQYEHDKSEQREQSASVVHRVEVNVHEERGEKRAQHSDPGKNR